MTAWAVPGVKVVCVDDEGQDGHADQVRRGAVYEIDRVYVAEWSSSIFVDLAGVATGGWGLWRFRPVAYPKRSVEQDVALFKRITEMVPA